MSGDPSRPLSEALPPTTEIPAMTVAEACRQLKCSEYRLAKLLDISQANITRWGRMIPPAWIPAVQKLIQDRK